jgi:photosystem II stability/assembly factor-like uncharacterized protein
MKKVIISFLFFFSSISLLTAQCGIKTIEDATISCGSQIELQTEVIAEMINSPVTDFLCQIYFYNHELGFIVGNNGAILKTTDAGHTWNLNRFLQDDNWVSVSFTTPSTGYIASSFGKIAKTTDGGTTWNVIYQNSSICFTKIRFINVTTGFAISRKGHILKTNDAGNSWDSIASGTNLQLNDITFVNETKGFIVGDYDYNLSRNTLLTTVNGGNTWTSANLNLFQRDLQSISFIDDNTGYISGRFLFKTTDGGNTWIMNDYAQLYSNLALWNETTGFSITDEYVFKFSNSGNILEIILSLDQLYYGMDFFSDIVCPDNQSFFTVTEQGRIFSYHSPTTYHWEPSTGLSADNISNPIASPDETTTYIVSAEASDGSIGFDTVTVYVEKSSYTPQIYKVTVDSASSHNKIIWNKPDFDAADSVFIYKEGNIYNQFARIASFSASQSGEYIDELSEGEIKSDIYTISILDRCSFESDKGIPHKTMHLSVNQGIGTSWNLIWEKYEGLQVNTHNIYRGSTPNNLQLIASISGSNTQYTDINAPTGNFYYQIEAILETSSGKSKSATSSFSNIKNTNNSSGGIGSIESVSNFRISSNPVINSFSILIDDINEISSLSLWSLNGKQLKEWDHPALPTFDIPEFPSGLYLLKVRMKSSNQTFMCKIVKL